MCFGGGGGPSAPTVDPEADRLKAQADATVTTNQGLLASARRRRAQKGRLATADTDTVLSRGNAVSGSVLGSGGGFLNGIGES